MAKLTQSQINQIAACIDAQVGDAQLRAELLDHCCCAIEVHLDAGMAFEAAREKAILQLHHDGLAAIEVDLFFQLNQIIPLVMKKLQYFTGFLAAMLLCSGLLFRFLHWPGADILLLCGHLLLLLTMLNLLVQLVRFPKAFDSLTFYRTLFGGLAGTFIAVGSTFKIFHWPSANIQFILGMGLFTLLFLPLYFWQGYRRDFRSGALN